MRFTALLVAGLVTSPAWAESPAPIFVSRSEVMAQKPRYDYPGIMRIWWLESSAEGSTRLLEVTGTIELHYHPDVDHRMFLLEGAMKVLVGDHEYTMKPGDFVFVPRLARHKMWLPEGVKRALYVTVDGPVASDPTKTVWLGPRPGSRPHAQSK